MHSIWSLNGGNAVNEFVDECRREWKRLRVPDSVADEMAAELAADLDEGASPEDVLGADAVDARSFAHRWASERGAIGRHGSLRRVALCVAVAVFAASAIAGAALLIAGSPSTSTRVALQQVPAMTPIGPQRVWIDPPSRLILAPAPTGFMTPTPKLFRLAPRDDSGFDERTLGIVLLVVGLGGVVPFALLPLRRLALDR
jgi:hypothetical protein